MKVVKQWLEGIGLPPTVVTNFQGAGIVKPEDLLELEVVHYEALGVDDPNDRRKLFFLVQRLKQAKAGRVGSGDGNGGSDAGATGGAAGAGGGGSNRSNNTGGTQSDDDSSSGSSSGGESGSGTARNNDDTHRSREDQQDYGDDDEEEETPPSPPPLDDERPMPRARRSAPTNAVTSSSSRPTSTTNNPAAQKPAPTTSTPAPVTRATRSATAKLSASKKKKKEEEQLQREQQDMQEEGSSDSSPVSASSAASISVPSVDENRYDNTGVAGADGDGDGANGGGATSTTKDIVDDNRPNSSGSSRGRTKTNAATSSTRSTRSTASSRGGTRSSSRAGHASASSAAAANRSPASSSVVGRTARSKSPVRTTGRTAATTASSSSRNRSRSPVRSGTTAAAARPAYSRTTSSRSKSPVRATAARSRSPVRGTAARSKSPVMSAAAAAPASRSKSPMRTARSKSPVRATTTTTSTSLLTTRTSAASHGRSKSPVNTRPASAVAMRGNSAGTSRSTRGSTTTRQKKTVAVATLTAAKSPTKAASTQTPPQKLRRVKAPEVDLADDIDSASDDEMEAAAFSSKGQSSKTVGSAGARPTTAKSRASNRRSMMQKQTSLPSLKSHDFNISDESSVGSKSSTGTNKSSSSRRRKSAGMASGSSTRRSDSSSGTRAGTSKRLSKVPGPSKIPSRTGSKGLSTIPAESVAIMSPLVKIQLEEAASARPTLSYDDGDEDDSNGGKTKARERRSGSLSSTGSSSRRRLSAPLARARSADLSSDEDASEKRVSKRRTAGGRQSLGGLVPPRNRSSSIGMSKRNEPAAPASPESRRSDSVVSSDIDLSAELDTSTSFGSAAAPVPPSGTVFVQGMPEDKSWGTQVSRIREDNDRAYELEVGPSGPNRDAGADDEMRIRVVVRKRPMSRKEAATKDDIDVIHPLDYDSYGKIMVYQPKTRVDLTKEVETIPFAFDNAFDESANNVDIYERTVSGLVPAVFDGKFCNVFAYGQTSAGKTFTMMGSNLTGSNAGSQDDSNPGLYYLAAQDVFYLANEEEFRHLTVTASLYEIYSGKLWDLLNKRAPIKCLEDHRGKVCFPGLTEHTVQSANELMQLMEAGSAIRSTGTTSKNADSSRSHAVLQLSLKNNRGRKAGAEHGRLTFIDLAGSERGADTSQASRATRLEGAEINTSLLALKEVIRALATGDSMKHIPFRGSKLTQVLKESFVGKNNRTVMVACVAPNMKNCEHTINTLRYADRVKERNAETGDVTTAAAAEASRIREVKKVPIPATGRRTSQRPVTAPISAGRSFDSGQSGSVIEQESEYSSRGSLQDFLDDEDDNGYEDIGFDTSVERERTGTGDSVVLDRLLSDDIDNGDDDDESGGSIPKPPTNREAAQSLIEKHRGIMSEMLNMVKREMILVNEADADRNTIEEYLIELEECQNKQLSMISTLREALLEYYGCRSNPSGYDDVRA